MSGRKNFLPSYHLLNAVSMTGDTTSNPVNIQGIDNVGIQLNFTGTPTGTFNIQISSDYNPQQSITGNWITMTFSTNPVASGSANQIYLDINQLSAPWIRVQYVHSSSTGTLDAYVTGKMI